VTRYLDSGAWPAQRLQLVCEPPLGWVAPNVLGTPGGPRPARGHFALRAGEYIRAPRLEVVQGTRVLWSGRLPRVMPGRSARLPAGWTASVDPGGPAVTVRLRSGFPPRRTRVQGG
jgi:hypothetical protein